MHLEIAVVGVGLAGKEALELAARRLDAKVLERRLGVGDHADLALGLTQLDQLERFGDFTFDPLIAADRLVEFCAFAKQFLGCFSIVPQTRVFGLGIQLGEAAGRTFPVKDASSAAPATC
jgi:hypothetical protein